MGTDILETSTETRLSTVSDLYELPHDDYRYELAQGRLVREPPPGARHGEIAATITARLWAHAREHGSGRVLTCDPGFVLHRSPDTVRAPDVAFVRRERLDAMENRSTTIPGPPDLAVEVLSPSDRQGDVHAKVADYLAAGTELVWVVDPTSECVTTYATLLAPQALTRDDELSAETLLPGFRLRVADVFE